MLSLVHRRSSPRIYCRTAATALHCAPTALAGADSARRTFLVGEKTRCAMPMVRSSSCAARQANHRSQSPSNRRQMQLPNTWRRFTTTASICRRAGPIWRRSARCGSARRTILNCAASKCATQPRKASASSSCRCSRLCWLTLALTKPIRRFRIYSSARSGMPVTAPCTSRGNRGLRTKQRCTRCISSRTPAMP